MHAIRFFCADQVYFSGKGHKVRGFLGVKGHILSQLQVSIANVARRSPIKTVVSIDEPRPCTDCAEKETFIDSQREEILFYKKKNKVGQRSCLFGCAFLIQLRSTILEYDLFEFELNSMDLNSIQFWARSAQMFFCIHYISDTLF